MQVLMAGNMEPGDLQKKMQMQYGKVFRRVLNPLISTGLKMKVEITQDISGTGDYRWMLYTGPEHIEEFTGSCSTLGECFELIVKWKTLHAQNYYG